ncbi:hypothetical protein CONPUDRAFT_144497 [Coniophora puteana RWD-64-598 SS2]|uniref:Uncharacterized protein n=1 Tax=Coniophora puteana (strain RWD-64-598) TaxID=741705 RepID=A0A5M3MMJ4_CONPW|nr:uncharacterized protein CONPUDRAFT_144497 [Coniophora puteana RWD-64-598 SS2]EIW80399.1 hypothetical protein CONPUDRAFT_144497 [Coniophora puteana RWD-64-598 SS2]
MGKYDDTLGVLLLAVVLNAYLYGVVMSQFFRYCQADINDHRALRYLLNSVLIVDTTFTALTIYGIWSIFIAHNSDSIVVAQQSWSIQTLPIATAWSTVAMHLFFTRRLWRLTSNKIWALVAVSLAICTFVLGMTFAIRALAVGANLEGASLEKTKSVYLSWLVATLVSDGFITGSLSIALLQARTVGFSKASHVAQQLLRGAIQTGVCAGIITLGSLLSYIFQPNTFLALLFAVPSGRVYTANRPMTRPVQLTSAISIHELETINV